MIGAAGRIARNRRSEHGDRDERDDRDDRGERGAGVLSTSFGIGVVLLLLTFAAHVLLGLWLRSAVDAVAFDLATDLATSGANDAELPAVIDRDVGRARDALGSYGHRVRFEVEPSIDRIVVHVRAPGLHLLPDALADPLGLDGLDRRITVRREAPDR